MTTPANLTFTDIQTRVMNQLRIPTSNTTEADKIAAVINEVYRDICAKQDWYWLLKRCVINTMAKIEDTAVTVTQDSASVTLSAVVTPDLTGFVMLTDGSDDWGAVYRVASHGGSSAAVTLDAPYTNASGTASVRFYRDCYTLPVDCGKVLNVKRYGYTFPLDREGIEFISHEKLWDTTEGKPQSYSVFDFACVGDPTSQRLLQVHPWPDKLYRLEVFYKQMLNTELSSTTRGFIPDDYVQVLIYGALSRCYPIFLSDTERGKYYGELFNDVLALMAAQQKEYAKDNPGVAPRNDYRTIPSRMSLRTSSRHSW